MPPVPPDEFVDKEPTASYAHSILQAIVDSLELKLAAGHTDIPKYLDRLVPRLYNVFIFLALCPDRRSDLVSEEKLLRVTGQVITLITQTASVE